MGVVFASGGCALVADSHNMQGVRHYRQGQLQPALQQFQEALVSHPNNADALYNIASTYYRLGKQNHDPMLLSQAEENYNRCLDLNANHVDCHRGLAVLLVETSRSDRAFTLLNNWTVRSPDNADARVQLARLYEESGNREFAKRYFQEALSVDRNNRVARVESFNALGRIREAEGKYDQAVENYRHSLQLNPMQAEITQRVASLAGKQTGGLDVSVPNDPRSIHTNAGLPR